MRPLVLGNLGVDPFSGAVLDHELFLVYDVLILGLATLLLALFELLVPVVSRLQSGIRADSLSV